MKKTSCLSILFSFFMTSFAMSQIPQTMSYQGVLTGADGNPVADGAVSFMFKLYDVATDGAALWQETQSLDVKGGIFNAILGSVTNLNLPFDKPYWLGITVGQEAEMTPRIALTASPYSLGATATVTEPKAGQSFVVRNANGDATHDLTADGDVTHAGTGTFLGGIVVGDTIAVPVDTTGTAGANANSRKKSPGNKIAANFPVIGIVASGTAIGVLGNAPTNGRGVQGQSTSGLGVLGSSKTREGVHGRSTSGVGVFGFSETNQGVQGKSTSGVGVLGVSDNQAGVIGRGQPAGWFQGKLKVDEVPAAPNQERFLVWDADNLVKYRTLPASGGGFDGTLVDKPFYLINANGDTVFSVSTDGQSVHKGQETFLGGIKLTDTNGGPGILIGQRSILMFDQNGDFSAVLNGDVGFDFFKPLAVSDTLTVKDANGNVVTMFAPDGTSLHKGDETFEGDVILKGTDGKGIKLVDANGATLAGFGRNDLQSGQRIGVFAKAENPGDLAAAFEGPVEVTGDLFVTDANGDTLTIFRKDGTSFHKGKESFAGGIAIVNNDGSTAIHLQPNTDPNTQYAVTINGNVDIRGIMMAETKQFKIDHPLDPQNKYLLHTSIESADMMNIYNGNVTLDNDGAVWVEMPDWFEALNQDFRYQLTCIGGFAQVYIAEEIHDNRFRIAGGAPGMKVSWQVTGIRHDAWAKEHQQPIEGYKR